MLPLKNLQSKVVASTLTSQSRKHGFTQATHLLSCLCPLPLCFPPHLTPGMDPDSGAFGGRKVGAVRKHSGSCTLKVCKCKIAFKEEEGEKGKGNYYLTLSFPITQLKCLKYRDPQSSRNLGSTWGSPKVQPGILGPKNSGSYPSTPFEYYFLCART